MPPLPFFREGDEDGHEELSTGEYLHQYVMLGIDLENYANRPDRANQQAIETRLEKIRQMKRLDREGYLIFCATILEGII